MGAGILPIALHNNEIYFLFAREGVVNGTDAGKWSDFGGSTERGETKQKTAIREGWEESNGIFGSIKDVESLVKNRTVKTIDIGSYRCYLVAIEYNIGIPRRFMDDYKYTITNYPNFVNANNGLYEKDRVQWVPFSKLKQNSLRFRPWYLQVVRKLLKGD